MIYRLSLKLSALFERWLNSCYEVCQKEVGSSDNKDKTEVAGLFWLLLAESKAGRGDLDSCALSLITRWTVEKSGPNPVCSNLEVCCDSSKASLICLNVEGVERHFGDLPPVKMCTVWSGLCTKACRQVEQLLQVCWRTSGKSLLFGCRGKVM